VLTGNGFTFPSSTSGFQRDRKFPSVMNVSLGIQQEIGFKTVVDVAYVGAFGNHLLWRRNLNAIPLGTTLIPANSGVPSQFFRPYIGYGDIPYSEYAGTSKYNSLQVMVSRRFARSLQFGVAYTLSHALDYVDSESTQVINGDVFGVSPRAFNYGTAGYDHTHVLKGSWTWDLPKASRLWNSALTRGLLDDWTWSGIATFQSGPPQTAVLDNVTLIDSTGSHSFSAASWSGSPWITSTDASARVDVLTNTGDLRTSVLAPPAQGALGNAGKGFLRGQWLNNWDMALLKRIPLGNDRWKLFFRAEAYNVFNHSNFTTIENRAQFTIDATNNNRVTETNPSFGNYTAESPKRRLQLALRLTF
jgi:hypothetical protein